MVNPAQNLIPPATLQARVRNFAEVPTRSPLSLVVTWLFLRLLRIHQSSETTTEREKAITESIHGACADYCTCLHESGLFCGSRAESTPKAGAVLREYCCSGRLYQCQGANIPAMIYQRQTRPCYKCSKLGLGSLNKSDVDERDESVTALVANQSSSGLHLRQRLGVPLRK